jgi:hypothetical protein
MLVFSSMLIDANTRDYCLEKRVKGDLADLEAPKRLPNRPLKSERLESISTGKINRIIPLSIFSSCFKTVYSHFIVNNIQYILRLLTG